MNRRLLLAYSGLFLVGALLMFYPFIEAGKGLVWDSDAVHQHLNAFIYLGRWLRDIVSSSVSEGGFVVPLWDFSIGYGSDIVTTMHYYAFGDPLNLLSALVPSRYAENAFGFLIVLRIYLAGLAFMAYVRSMGSSSRSAILGALVYAFCGWSLIASIRHPYFINPMIYLPLLAWGFEKILRKETPFLFIGAVFISAISNFYFFYMLLIAIVLYALFRFPSLPHPSIASFGKLFGRSLFYGCTGVLMACIVLIPVIVLFLNTERSGIQLQQDPWYSQSFYFDFPLAFITPTLDQNWTLLGFTPVALLSLVILFLTRGYRPLKVAVILFTVLLLLPSAGTVFNGFSYATNRWCWIYSFIIALSVTAASHQIPQLMEKRQAAIVAGITVVLYSLISGGMLFLLEYQLFPSFSTQYIEGLQSAIVPSLVLTAATGATFSLFALTSKKGMHFSLPTLSAVLIGITLVSVGVNAYGEYATLNIRDNYLDAGKAYEKITSSAATDASAIQKKDSVFSRFEAQRLGVMNPSDIVGAHGIQYYWSLGPAPISQYYTALGLSTRRTAYSYRSLECRAPLYALASVKYYIGREGSEPFGFHKVEDYKLKHSSKKALLYENSYALPLGYTYGSYQPQSEFLKLPLEERQEALLENAIIPEDSIRQIPASIQPGQFSPTCQSVPLSMDGSVQQSETPSGVSIQPSTQPEEVTLSFQGLPRSETYLIIKNITANRIVDAEGHWGENERMQVNVSSEKITTHFKFSTDYFKWTTGQRDYLVSLGYSEEGQTGATLTFPAEAEYHIDDIQVVCQPMDNFPAQIEKLRETTLEDVEMEPNTVSGTIEADRDKILCLSIPYSTGWRAEVDGQPADLFQANIMFMGLAITPGKHSVVLYYETPGLKLGVIASLAGVILFATIIVFYRKRRMHCRPTQRIDVREGQ